MSEVKLSVQSQEWEAIYSSDSFRNKNQYPSEEIISFLMRRFGARPDKAKIHILDVGCGWGNNLSFLRAQGFTYAGIDFSKTAVAHCRKLHDQVVCADLVKMPWADSSFDVAFDRMAIQHNPHDTVKKIFAEVRRVLKPGGIFYSAFIESGECGVLTTYLNEQGLRELARDFSRITVDYVIQTLDNQTDRVKTNVLVAEK